MTRLTTTLALTFALVAGSFASAQQFPQIRYRFGMQVSLTGNGNIKGLFINTVTPGGPADQSGLAVGDVIVTSNGWNFQDAFTDADAVRILQASVSNSSGGGIPTAMATATSNGQFSRPSATLVIVRYDQQISGTVFPIDIRGGFPTAPAPHCQYPPELPIGGGNCGGGNCGGGNTGGGNQGIPTL